MKHNYQKCIKLAFLLICTVLSQYSGFSMRAGDKPAGEKLHSPMMSEAFAVDNTPCAGTSTAASQGAFSTGYSYSFQTVGNSVNVSFTLLDTDKVGVVAYLWRQTPFAETAMTNAGGLTFTSTITGQTPGATINYAVKFAYAGGLAVTQYISYVVGENCTGGNTDTQAPTGFTATLGTVTAGSVQLLLNGTDNSGSVIYTVTYGSQTATATGTSGTQQPLVINNLTAGTAYNFSVTAADAAGNAAANNPIVVAASTSAAPVNTACAGTGTAAQQGAFSTGYSYEFETVGNSVTATFTMLDTDKVGVVAYLWQQTPFAESPMANAGGLTFTKTITGQTPGATIGLAVKFAYAGGLVVTQYINYVVGENCTGGGADTAAPTGFTASVGTVNATSVQLLLNGTDDSGTVVYTITYGTNTTTVTGASGVQQATVINGLTAGTAYNFSVTASDAAGNTAANNPIALPATTLQPTSTVACTGTETAAQQGSFSTGYSYSIQTVNGTDVNVTFTMLDTDKVGVVAYLWQQTPFAESPMANAGGLTFTKTLTGQTPGATIGLAVKFAYAGGLVVTQYISYVVGQDCAVAGDTQAPTGFTATAGAITGTSVELLLNGTDNSGSVVYTITYGSETTTVTGDSGEQESVIIDELSAGTAYTFSVTAADAAGNMAANNPIAVQATTLDGGTTNTPCAGTATAAQQGSFSTGYSYEFETNGTDVTATFTMLDTDKVGVVAYLWQETPFGESPMANAGGLTFTKTLTGQTPGATIGLAVKFAYAGGLVVTDYIDYVVGENCNGGGDDDTEAPTGFTATAGAITGTSVELLLNATDDSGSVVYTITYGSETTTVTADSGEQESVIIDGLTAETAYTFSVTAADAAGNTAGNNPIAVQATTLEDGGTTNTPCAGTSSEATQGAFSTGYSYSFETVGSTVNVTFTLLDTDKVGVVAYLWQQTPFSESPMTNAGGLAFTKTLTGQVPGSTITYAVKFAYAGGLSVTQYFSYVVGDDCDGGGGEDDSTAPADFTAAAGTITPTSIQLLLNGTDDSGIVIYTITYNGNTTTVVGTSGEQTSVVLNNLAPDTDFTFSVTAADGAGNVAANNPLEVQAATLEASNTDPCSGSGTAAQQGALSTGYNYSFETINGTDVKVTITMLDTDKVGVVAYLWQQTPFMEYPMANVEGLTFSNTLTGQVPGTTINIAVKFAYAGGLVVTEYISYVVGQDCSTGEDDTEAPTGLTGSVGTVTATTVQLLLNGTDNSGSVTYTITYNGNTVTVTGTSGEEQSVIIDNLSPESGYTFTITATDAAGNTATSNVTLEALTPEDTNTECAGVSTEAQDGEFSTGYSYSFETSGNDVTVTFELLDTDKVGVVAYLWQQTPFTETPMTNTEGLTFTATVTGQTPGQDVTFAVKFAYAGGLSVTKYFTYTVGEDCNLGIDEPQLDASVKLYPNPASSIVNIASDIAEVTKVEIYSVLGTKVLETANSVINIENLSDGMYLVKIHAGNKSITKKLIVE